MKFRLRDYLKLNDILKAETTACEAQLRLLDRANERLAKVGRICDETAQYDQRVSIQKIREALES